MKRATQESLDIIVKGGISIHALMKRATKRINYLRSHQRISIHALMKRATFSIKLDTPLMDNFNPRPHEEGDLLIRCGVLPILNFNPRPHEEGDLQHTAHDL